MHKFQTEIAEFFQPFLDYGTIKCLYDGDFTIVSCDQEFCDLLGAHDSFEVSNHFHKKFVDMIVPEDFKDSMGKIEAQLLENGRCSCTFRIKTIKNSELWVAFSAKKVIVEKKYYLECVVINVNSFVQMRNQHEVTMNSIPGGVAYMNISDHDFWILDASDSFIDMIGVDKNEYLEENVRYINEDDLPKFREYVCLKAKNKEPIDIEFGASVPKHEKSRWFRMVGQFYKEIPEGKQYLVVMIDNTEKHAIMAALEREKERYRLTKDKNNPKDGRNQSNADVRKMYEAQFSKHYERMFKVEVETKDYEVFEAVENKFREYPTQGYYDNMIAHVASHFVHPDDRGRFLQLEKVERLTDLLNMGETEIVRYYRMRTIGSEYRWKCSRCSYFDPDMKYIIISLQDVHDIRMEQQRMEDTNRHILVNALNEAKKASDMRKNFLEIMSKGFSQPMQTIYEASVDTMSEKDLGIEDYKEKLEVINASTMRVFELFKQVSEVERAQDGKISLHKESVCLHRLFGKSIDKFREMAREHHVELVDEREIPEDRVYYCDEFRMREMFDNILANCVGFSPVNERIRVVIYEENQGIEDTTLCISVEDNGAQINKELFERIYVEEAHSMFTEGPYTKESTGFSLILAKNLIELMDGKIEIFSGNQGENYFLIKLPLYYKEDNIEEIQSMEELDSEISTINLSNYSILYFQGEDSDSQMLASILKVNGANIYASDDTYACLESYMNSEEMKYNVILLDNRIKDFEFFEVANMIRSSERYEAKSIPIFVLTESNVVEDIRRDLKKGINTAISKPVDITRLVQVLDATQNGILE